MPKELNPKLGELRTQYEDETASSSSAAAVSSSGASSSSSANQALLSELEDPYATRASHSEEPTSPQTTGLADSDSSSDAMLDEIIEASQVLQKQLEELKQEYEELQREHELLKDNYNKQQIQNQVTTQTLKAKYQKALQQLNQENADLRKNLRENNKLCSASLGELEALKKTHAQEIEQLQKEKDELQARLASFREFHKNIQNNLEIIKTDSDELRQQSQKLQEKNQNLNGTVNELKIKATDDQTTLQELTQKIGHMQSEAKEHAEQAARIIDNLEKELSNARKQAQSSQQKLQELKQTSSTPTPSAPPQEQGGNTPTATIMKGTFQFIKNDLILGHSWHLGLFGGTTYTDEGGKTYNVSGTAIKILAILDNKNSNDSSKQASALEILTNFKTLDSYIKELNKAWTFGFFGGLRTKDSVKQYNWIAQQLLPKQI